MSDEILVERDGGIATVIFNRPRMRNALSLAMWSEIADVTEGLAKDDAVRAIVYRGAGRDAFASGADISEFTENRKDTQTALAYNKKTEAAYTSIRLCPKPTVAMVFGFCMGGAMALAMACDFRFARSEEHTSELQSRRDLVCRLLLEKKKEMVQPSRRIHQQKRHCH